MALQTMSSLYAVLRRNIAAWLVLAAAAVLAALPLLTHGYSCGHDFDFHLRSWMEASTQWKAGIVKPVWAFHAAWNAGEPRLLFYPPLSWITGALLTLMVPWSGIVFAFTALVFLLSGITMHRLLRRWTTPGVAVLGGCLYIVNPYMLFCAYERTAYAELMAAAWIPLLLAALLRERISVWRIALALSLLWLTNAPAGVMGCYTVLLIAGMRLLPMVWRREQGAWRFAGHVTAGVLLGLLLDSVYLFPFAMERRYISLTAALTPNASPDANYLYQYTQDEFHNGVIRHSSNIATVLVTFAVVCGAAALLLHRRRVRSFAGMNARDATAAHDSAAACATPVLMAYSVAVLVLQLPVTAFLWHHAPELNFLQFPWRLLAMQGAVTAALAALLVQRVAPTRHRALYAATGLLLAAVAAYGLANRTFRQGCDSEEGLGPQWAFFHAGQGFEQTDEYTPAEDDNDALKIHLPQAWITTDATSVPKSGDGSLPAGTALPREQSLRVDDWVVTPSAKSDGQFLIVRLRPFHGWHVLLDGTEVHAWPARPDGLLAVPLGAAGPHRVEVRYRKPWDQWVGGALSVLALAILIALAQNEPRHRAVQ